MVVRQRGSPTRPRADLMGAVTEGNLAQSTQKIVSLDELSQQAKLWRSAGEKIILANGCFDLLHVGHVRDLRAAKELGGRVVVAVNSDSMVRPLKRPGRPPVPDTEPA